MPDERTPVTVDMLLSVLPDAIVDGDSATEVSSIVFDSRSATAGSCFVAMRGGYADGHGYLSQALQAGSVAAVVEPETPAAATVGFRCIVRIPDTRGALARIANCFYGNPSRELSVVGITGTDGKTTTSFYLQQILEWAGHPTGLISTVAVRVPGQPDRSSARQTTPESLDVQRTLREMVDAKADIAVIETTSHALETHRVDCCAFDVGVITNITREHLDFHGSIENYRAAKGGLLKRVAEARELGKRGTVVLNADDPGCRSVVPFANGADVIWYSSRDDGNALLHAEDITALPDANIFTLVIGGDRYPVRLPLPGSWNVDNALAAAGAAYALGCPASTIASGVSKLRSVPGRMEKVDLGQPFTVIIDYAHTPEALRSVLNELRRTTPGRILTAFGSAGERDTEKRPIQGAISIQLSDYAVFTSEDPRFEDPDAIVSEIAAGAIEHGAVRGVDFDCIEDRRAAVAHVIERAQPGDVVLLAGKGHERSMIYGAEHRPWNEATVARDVLRQLGYRSGCDEGNTA